MNFKLWALIIMYKYWLINCSKHTTLIQHANKWGNWCGDGERIIWKFPLLSTQLFYKHKTNQNRLLIKIKKTTLSLLHGYSALILSQVILIECTGLLFFYAPNSIALYIYITLYQCHSAEIIVLSKYVLLSIRLSL